VLALYAREVGPTVASPGTLASGIKSLAPFWGGKTCDAVKGSTCRAYERERAKPIEVEYVGKKGGRWVRTLAASNGTVRRELGVLQAALNYAHAEGVLIYVPTVTLPETGAARDRWLTKPEAALLLRAAAPHVRRFIVIALATGRRASAILGLRLGLSLDSGWIDTAGGVIHFEGARHLFHEVVERAAVRTRAEQADGLGGVGRGDLIPGGHGVDGPTALPHDRCGRASCGSS